MKTKLLLLLILFSQLEIRSQDRQNDATWNETLEFIDFNSRGLRGQMISSDYVKAETLETKISIEENSIIVGNKFQIGNSLSTEVKILNFYDLSSARIEEDKYSSYLMLYSREDGQIIYHEEDKISSTHFIRIGIASKELKDRMLKAFSHLAYLSNQLHDKNKTNSKF